MCSGSGQAPGPAAARALPAEEGPCPVSGAHHYVYRLYALDAEDLQPRQDGKAGVLRAMEGHVLAYGELVGTYQLRNTSWWQSEADRFPARTITAACDWLSEMSQYSEPFFLYLDLFDLHVCRLFSLLACCYTENERAGAENNKVLA